MSEMPGVEYVQEMLPGMEDLHWCEVCEWHEYIESDERDEDNVD